MEKQYIEYEKGKMVELDVDDALELTDDQASELKLMRDVMPEVVEAFKRSRGRPAKAQPKAHVGMRLDADIVAWLRSQEGYNAFVNDVLRREMGSNSM